MKGFVGIGTFEKKLGISKSIDELKADRKEKFIKDVDKKVSSIKKATDYKAPKGVKLKKDTGLDRLGGGMI